MGIIFQIAKLVNILQPRKLSDPKNQKFVSSQNAPRMSYGGVGKVGAD